MNSEVQKVSELIKTIWPKLQITKENLSRPTGELVITFYSNFLFELEEKLQCWTDPYYTSIQMFNNDNLEREEQLFVKIAPILKSFDWKLHLCDIYEPSSVRTKYFFYICCHLIIYGYNICEDIERLTTGVIQMKDETVMLMKEREELQSEIKELATRTSQSLDDFDNIKEKLKTTQNCYEEMKELKSNKDNIYLSKRKQIEELNRELQQEEYELNKLEDLEKILLEQVTTEEEYTSLKTMAENLEIELKNLGTDDNNMEDLLVFENDVSLHYQECLKIMHSLNDFSASIVISLLEREEVFKNIQKTNDSSCNKINHLNLLKLQYIKRAEDLNECLGYAIKEECEIKTEFTTNKVNFEKHLMEVENENKEQYENKINYIKSYTEDKRKSEDHMKRLKENFAIEYIKLHDLDRKTKEHYKTELINLCKQSWL